MQKYKVTSAKINMGALTRLNRTLLNSKFHGNLEIPASFKSIEESAFANCTGLMSVNISNSVEVIGESAFKNCTGLRSVNIPNSVKIIGELAFENCTGLVSVNIPNSVKLIGESAFENCKGLTSVNIKNGIVCIDESAFRNCINLTQIIINGEKYATKLDKNGVLVMVDSGRIATKFILREPKYVYVESVIEKIKNILNFGQHSR